MLRVNELSLMLLTICSNSPNRPRRHTRHYRVIWYIMGHDRLGADDAISTYCHPGHDYRIHTDMTVVTNRNTSKPINIRKLGI